MTLTLTLTLSPIKACTILEGLLASLQLEGADFTACAADLDQAWQSIPTAMRRSKW